MLTVVMNRRTALRLTLLSVAGSALAACGSSSQPVTKVATGTWDLVVSIAGADPGRSLSTAPYRHYAGGTVTVTPGRFRLHTTGHHLDLSGTWGLKGRTLSGTLDQTPDASVNGWSTFVFAGLDAAVGDAYTTSGPWALSGPNEAPRVKLSAKYGGKVVQLDLVDDTRPEAGTTAVRTIATKR